MGKELICSVTSDGKTSWWHSKEAGSFLNSSELYRLLVKTKELGHEVDQAMAMMSYSTEDPAKVSLEMESEGLYYQWKGMGEPAFQEMTTELAEDGIQDDSVMVFHLNMDRQRVEYVRPQLLTGKVMAMREIDVLNCRWDPSETDNKEEAVFQALRKRAAHWYKARGKNAVCEITECCKTRYYYTDFGGGHCNPIMTLNTMRSTGSFLHEMKMRSDVFFVVSGLLENMMIGADRFSEEEALQEIESRRALRLAERMAGGHDDIGIYVRMNFDTQIITFIHGPQSRLPILEISFDQASNLLEEARIDVDNNSRLVGDYDELCEKRLVELLLCTQTLV